MTVREPDGRFLRHLSWTCFAILCGLFGYAGYLQYCVMTYPPKTTPCYEALYHELQIKHEGYTWVDGLPDPAPPVPAAHRLKTNWKLFERAVIAAERLVRQHCILPMFEESEPVKLPPGERMLSRLERVEHYSFSPLPAAAPPQPSPANAKRIRIPAGKTEVTLTENPTAGYRVILHEN